MPRWEVTVAFVHPDQTVNYDHDEFADAATSEEAIQIVNDRLKLFPELSVVWARLIK